MSLITPAQTDAIQVLVVDDDPLVRMGLRSVLAAGEGIEVAAEASDGDECLDVLRTVCVDVVLMDIRMPRRDGIETTRELTARSSAPSVIVLTTFSRDEYVVSALQAGASGFILKDSDPLFIIEAIRTVHRGDALVDPAVTRSLVRQILASGSDPELPRLRRRVERLTPAETSVLSHIASGASNLQIASELHISEGAVKAHINRMYPKLEVDNRVKAAILAYKLGLA